MRAQNNNGRSQTQPEPVPLLRRQTSRVENLPQRRYGKIRSFFRNTILCRNAKRIIPIVCLGLLYYYFANLEVRGDGSKKRRDFIVQFIYLVIKGLFMLATIIGMLACACLASVCAQCAKQRHDYGANDKIITVSMIMSALCCCYGVYSFAVQFYELFYTVLLHEEESSSESQGEHDDQDDKATEAMIQFIYTGVAFFIKYLLACLFVLLLFFLFIWWLC